MILLTGASGFIGQYLLKALIKDYGKKNVLALTSKPIKECQYLLHNDYKFGTNYFIDSGYANSIDTLIHAGAFIPKEITQANNWKLCNQNIYNTQKLLETELPNLRKVIYLSTVDVYDKNDTITEFSNIGPVSLYGYSKLYSEQLITTWAKAENKICQILRVGHVYGPGEEAYQKIIPATMKKIIKKGNVQIWGTGNEMRSFIYIDDVVEAILNSLKLDTAIGPVNLVGTQSVTIKELVNKIIRISGKEVKIETVPVNTMGRNLVFDNGKMKQYLLPAEIPLDEGLSKEWQYMMSL